MKYSDLVKKNKDELVSLLIEKKKEYMKLRILASTNQDYKTSDIRICRRDIARLNTCLNNINVSK